MSQDPDVQLARQIRAGDTAAFESLFALYYTGLLNYLTYQLRTQELAEDLLQSVFLDLWDRRERFFPAHGIRAYLYAAAHHRFLNYCRRERRAAALRDDYVSLTGMEEGTVEGNPLATLEQRDLEQAVRQAIAALPERARETFTLHREHGLSYQEIANVMEVSVNTVKTQVTRSVAAIRRALTPFLALLLVAHLS